jgi:hypothetical protein
VKLLLDGHIKKATIPALRSRCPGVDAIHIADWREGIFRTAEDSEILQACLEEARIFVTYDLRTIPNLLRRWAAEDRSHAGVIFGDGHSVPPNDPAAIATALATILKEISTSEMTNVIRYLRRSG